jgi:hypothetical protein
MREDRRMTTVVPPVVLDAITAEAFPMIYLARPTLPDA